MAKDDNPPATSRKIKPKIQFAKSSRDKNASRKTVAIKMLNWTMSLLFIRNLNIR